MSNTPVFTECAGSERQFLASYKFDEDGIRLLTKYLADAKV